MQIPVFRSIAAAIAVSLSAAAATPDPKSEFLNEFVNAGPWRVCGMVYGPHSAPHTDYNAQFTFEPVPNQADTVRIVPLTGSWEAGWWHLQLKLQGEPQKAFKLNPKSWPIGCTGAGKDNQGEQDEPADESKTIRFVGDTCLPNAPVAPGKCDKKSEPHRVFVLLRPAANGGASGNHLYIEHCAPAEEINGHCEPMRLNPHPGHIHSDP